MTLDSAARDRRAGQASGLPRRRFLVAGWFSLESVIATVGDEMGAGVVAGWLAEAGHDCDVAYAGYLRRGVCWRTADPSEYDGLVFVSGPLVRHEEMAELLDRFAGIFRMAVNVSRVEDGLEDRFDAVVFRDGAPVDHPDVALMAPREPRPVVAVAYAPAQAEYPSGRHADAHAAIRSWLRDRKLATIPLDMDLFVDHRYEVWPGQVESLVARADVVISMRLHAMVMAIRHDRPVIAVDAIPGGAKVKRQADRLGWPAVVTADELSGARLDELLDFCLGPDARPALTAARQAGLDGVGDVRRDLLGALQRPGR